MTQAMIFSTVLLTGAGCGVGCGSISTPFLISRMVGEQRGTKECMQASGLFLIGKLCMLSVLGLLSSLGRRGTRKRSIALSQCNQMDFPRLAGLYGRAAAVSYASSVILRTMPRLSDRSV